MATGDAPSTTSTTSTSTTSSSSASSVGDPGIRVRDELLHVRRKLPREHVGQRDLLEHRAQAGPDGDPDLLEVLGGAEVAGGLGAVTPDFGQGPVEGADHVGDG